MKKMLNILFVIILLIPYIIIPSVIKGQTLGDIERELAEIEKNLDNQEEEEKLTKEEQAKLTNDIKVIEENIRNFNADIIQMEEDIKKLNQEIIEKEKEIREILKFLQISNGESAYLEYTFGAKSFTDFIYRAAVIEQLASYNDSLIKEYNDMIESNKKKTKEHQDKIKEQSEEKVKLSEKIKQLGSKLNDIYDIKIDLKSDIRIKKDVIESYKSMGCKSNDEIEVCTSKGTPTDTSFSRPVNNAVITSGFGWRTFSLDGTTITDFHTGIDLAYSGDAVPIYAAAAGIVVSISEYPNSVPCGGNTIFINHIVNGKQYMTMYMHLRKILVKQNQVVTKNTQIATMGGDPKREWWDSPKCSSGQHLHFTMTNKHYDTNLYLGGVYTYKINPADEVNFPGDGTSNSVGKWIYGRYTEY